MSWKNNAQAQAQAQAQNGRISFEIVEKMCVLSTKEYMDKNDVKKTLNLELNRVAFNGGEPMYDIRWWSPGYDYMTKGIRIPDDGMDRLYDFFIK